MNASIKRSLNAVIGLRPHTGWTCLVALAGDPRAPELTDRRRLQFAEADAARFVYHNAGGLPGREAKASVERASAAAMDAARTELNRALDELRGEGLSVRDAACPEPRATPGALDEVLASHGKIHAAEGWLWRSTVAEACRSAGLAVTMFDEKSLMARTAAALGMDERELQSRLAAMGKAAGPPWAEDQRICAAAAWLAMTET